MQTGLVDSGKDFGSYSVKPINKRKVLLLSGEGISSLNFGELWHFFETQLKYPVTIVNTERFGSIDLDQYDVIVMPNGYYGSAIDENQLKKLENLLALEELSLP